jgi:hypothetical protein
MFVGRATSMTRRLYAILVVLLTCLGCGLAASSRAEEPTAAQWVPFVAKWVQKYELQALRGPYTTVLSGVYVRDKEGSWFRRRTVKSSRLPIIGYTDTAFLYDRANQKLYLLDFARKTIKPLQVNAKDQPESGGSPMSPQTFEQNRSQDKFLGKRIISGVECEGYAIHDPRRKGKYVSEVWFAPSLNYLAIETKRRVQGDQEVTARVEEIQIGKEPDPQYFRLPEGFKMIK